MNCGSSQVTARYTGAVAVEEYTIVVNAPRSAEAEVEAAVADGFDRSYAMFVTDPWTDELGETVLVDVDIDDAGVNAPLFIAALREKITKATGYTTSTEDERDAALASAPLAS